VSARNSHFLSLFWGMVLFGARVPLILGESFRRSRPAWSSFSLRPHILLVLCSRPVRTRGLLCFLCVGGRLGSALRVSSLPFTRSGTGLASFACSCLGRESCVCLSVSSPLAFSVASSASCSSASWVRPCGFSLML